jgi:hypothetical protein
MKLRREKAPDPRSIKIMGIAWVLEAVLVAFILLGRFVFGWF